MERMKKRLGDNERERERIWARTYASSYFIEVPILLVPESQRDHLLSPTLTTPNISGFLIFDHLPQNSKSRYTYVLDIELEFLLLPLNFIL